MLWLSVLLAGCLQSDAPLIDADGALTPLAPGFYEQCSDLASGAHEACEITRLELADGKRYRTISIADESVILSLGPLQGEQLLVQVEQDSAYHYGVMRTAGATSMAVFPNCGDVPATTRKQWDDAKVVQTALFSSGCTINSERLLRGYLDEVASDWRPGSPMLAKAKFRSLRYLGPASANLYMQAVRTRLAAALAVKDFHIAAAILGGQFRRPVSPEFIRELGAEFKGRESALDAWAAEAQPAAEQRKRYATRNWARSLYGSAPDAGQVQILMSGPPDESTMSILTLQVALLAKAKADNERVCQFTRGLRQGQARLPWALGEWATLAGRIAQCD